LFRDFVDFGNISFRQGIAENTSRSLLFFAFIAVPVFNGAVRERLEREREGGGRYSKERREKRDRRKRKTMQEVVGKRSLVRVVGG